MASYTSILSFDVGIRHLAFCALRVPVRVRGERVPSKDAMRGAIIDRWDMIDLETVKSVDACCKRLTDELFNRFKQDHFDVVLIERQPKHRSIMMVAIQMFLCGYFNVSRAINESNCKIKFMHASRKLECCTSSITFNTSIKGNNKAERLRQQAARYKDNKKRAIEGCIHYLHEVLEDYANAALLEQYPKKDDLCDAFLQAVAYVEELA